MKKIIVTLLVIAAFAGISSCNNTAKQSQATTDTQMEDIFSQLNKFEKATTTETYLNDSLAQKFPGTLLFFGQTKNKKGNVIIVNSLPATFSSMTDLTKALRELTGGVHMVNVTLLEDGDHFLALLPKHSFENDLDLSPALEEYGMKFDQINDLISIRFKKKGSALNVAVLDELDSSKIDGKPCTVRTLNTTGRNGELCQYVTHGVIHWIKPEVKKRLDQIAKSSNGGRVHMLAGNGEYAVRVEDSLWNKILGMSGGSVVVNIDGKDVLLGMNTARMRYVLAKGTDTSMITMLGFQPIVSADLGRVQPSHYRGQ